MPRFVPPVAVLLVCLQACQSDPPLPSIGFPAARPLVYRDSLLLQPLPPRPLSKAMIPVQPDSLLRVPFEPLMFKAMREQAKYLRRDEVKEFPVTGISKHEMLHTVRLLQACSVEPPGNLLEYFDFYQINTELKSDRVRITGYYTPVMEVSRTQTPQFPVPMLKRPDSGVPSPAAIESGALSGRNLELAWVKSKRDLANAQLQGSCLVQFPDGDHDFLGFGGSVKGHGGTYVFFTKIDKDVLGSGTFPLTAGYSAAIDPRFIPIGATLLAELPVCDKAGNTVGYEYRIIFAQDRGGAIQTTKRMDLYCGIGKDGLTAAKRVNAHGRLWLMLPKKD